MATINTTIPDFSVGMVNPATGMIDPTWYQFLLKILARTDQSGGTVNSVSGTAPIVSSGGSAPSISITPASSGFPGSMSSSDKAKLDAIGTVVASVTGTAPIASSGGATPAISISPATGTNAGSLSAADKTKLDTVTANAAVASVTGTAPIVSSGGATPAISIVAATPSVPGSMSAADKTKLDSIPGAITCFLAYQNTGGGQSLVGGVQTPAIFGTKAFDDTSEYSIATSKFTAVNAGTYVFNAGMGGTQGTATRRQISVYVNAAVRAVMQDSTASSGLAVLAGSSGPVRLAAGDAVNIEFYSTLADSTSVGQAITYFSGWRIK